MTANLKERNMAEIKKLNVYQKITSFLFNQMYIAHPSYKQRAGMSRDIHKIHMQSIGVDKNVVNQQILTGE